MCRSTTLLSARKSTPHSASRISSRRQHPSGIGREQVEQVLLQPGQVQLGGPGAHVRLRMSISSSPSRIVGVKATGRRVAAPHHRQHARHQLLGREGDGQQVIHAPLEGGQLRLEVAPPGQSDNRDTF